MITLQCQLKPEDYIQATRLHMRQTWLKYLALLVLGLYLAIFIHLIVTGSSLALMIERLLPFSILVLTYGVIYFVIQPWNARRIFSQQKTLQAEYEMVISPDTITSTTKNGYVEMPLSDFHKYKVGKDLILVYQSQALFHMFPRRFFASDEDYNTFLLYLEANLSPAK
ncbi:MAG: YcxB family protein [Cyanobacteria bacterium P01_H01_bin.21]